MPKILLVEDDPMIAEIYQRKFEAAGFEIKVAATGKEVLNNVKKEHFDVVLLDLVLPEMSGFDVLKEIKQSGKYDASQKIIVFSNLNEKTDQDKAFELGADGFIHKSQFSPTQLVGEIMRLMKELNEQEKNEMKENNSGAMLEENGNAVKKRILFIEDEDVFIEMFAGKLESEGYEVVVEKNGALAVKKALAENFDLIITDMIVIAMSGDEVVASLKREEKTKNIPIIVLSASLMEENLAEIKSMGVEDYYLKTRITPSDLVKRVGEILEK